MPRTQVVLCGGAARWVLGVRPILLQLECMRGQSLLPFFIHIGALGLQTHHIDMHLLSSHSLLKQPTSRYFVYSENAKRVHNHCYQTQY